MVKEVLYKKHKLQKQARHLRKVVVFLPRKIKEDQQVLKIQASKQKHLKRHLKDIKELSEKLLILKTIKYW